MKFENIIDEIGHFGYAQKLIVTKLFMCSWIYVTIIYCTIVHLSVPLYRCKNDTSVSTDYVESECFIYSPSDNKSSLCEEWEYDQTEFTSTLASEFNMICMEEYKKPLIETLPQVGFIVSAVLLVPYADRYGRKIPLIAGVVLGVAASFFVTIFTTFIELCIINIIVGIFSCLILNFSMTIGSEFVGTQDRLLVVIILHFAWPLGVSFEALVSYYVRESRLFHCAMLLPALFMLPFILTIPESPRWLICRGEEEKAWEILEWTAKKNGVKLQKTEPIVVKSKDTETFLHAMAKPKIRTRFFVASWIYFGNLLLYYASFMESANLIGNVRLSMIGGGVFEVFAMLVAFFCDRRFGRKWVICFGFLLCALSNLAYLHILFVQFISAEKLLLIVTVATKFFLCMNGTIVWMYVPELFPTTCRSSVMGPVLFIAYLGSCTAPYIGNLNVFHGQTENTSLSLGIFGLIALLSAILTLKLPETKHLRLAETLEDAENM